MAKKRKSSTVDESPADLSMIADGLRSLAVDIESLVPDPDNARQHDEINLAAITASLREFGQHRPVVVQRNGMIIRAGNGLVESAKRLGWTHVAALVLDEDDARATARAIADNRTADLSQFDERTLARLLKRIGNSPEMNAGAVGFSAKEISALIDKYEGEPADLPSITPIQGFSVEVVCEGESQQRIIYDRFMAEGLKCRVLTY